MSRGMGGLACGSRGNLSGFSMVKRLGREVMEKDNNMSAKTRILALINKAPESELRKWEDFLYNLLGPDREKFRYGQKKNKRQARWGYGKR